VRTRNLIIGAIVLVVAVAATTFVITRPPAIRLVPTIIPTEAIPANQLLDPLIEEGLFEELYIPSDALLEGAVTDVRDLYGLRTLTPILANEQIKRSWLTARDYLDQGHVPRR
jgi:hypothetical protein